MWKLYERTRESDLNKRVDIVNNAFTTRCDEDSRCYSWIEGVDLMVLIGLKSNVPLSGWCAWYPK
jgi:hypothetical protein